LFQICSIFSKILVGFAYFSTSIHSNFPRIGNKNIEATVIINQKIAYLIVLIAGLILSSFHPDNIRSNPQYNTKTIDNIPAVSTKIEITSKTKSQNSILFANIGEFITLFVVSNHACAIFINDIVSYIINLKLLNLFFYQFLIIKLLI
jgi:hypothetical protein